MVQSDFDGRWRRKHDDPRRPAMTVPEIAFPRTLDDVVELCRRPAPKRLKAAGSHWALSEAAISDHTFIETRKPDGSMPGLTRTLFTVVPGALHPDLLEQMRHREFADVWGTFVAIESGKRVCQLYAELDEVDDLSNDKTLGGFMKRVFQVSHFAGPWGFKTLGGAGGQTVVGALNTGTHGGDFDRPPIADAVHAIHLVADGGRQYWIERVHSDLPQLFDDDKLHDAYGPSPDFEIIREPDNALFDAVLVSAGRFGVIYSVVLRAARQYSLWERRKLDLWQNVKSQIADVDGGTLFTDTAPEATPPEAGPAPNHFLQVVVCLTPHHGFSRNLAGVTKRWTIPVDQAPEGRAQRVGRRLSPPEEIEEPEYELVGNANPYAADDEHPYKSASPDFLDRACSNGSFVKGALKEAERAIEKFVDSNGTVVTGGVAAAAVVGGVALLALLAALLIVLVAIKELIEAFADDDRLGEHMERIKNTLLDPNQPDPELRAAGLFAWQVIAYEIFSLMQDDMKFGARSYAVMDRKNYLDQSCEINVESTELFFDAVDDRLPTFIDALIAYEISQELQGKAFLGYVSLRFTGPTQAMLGMQRYGTTCSVEVAGLKDLSGSEDLVRYAARLGLNPGFGGIQHWGQLNTANRDDTQRIFGDPTQPENGPLGAWRQQLGRVTESGTFDAFSSEFTRRTGLEES
jgi:hypothetical protein